MTYKESLDIAFLKTDGDASDYESGLFPVLANEAQMYIAKYGSHIVRSVEFVVEKAPHKMQLPDDFYRIAPMGIVSKEDDTEGVDYYIAEDEFLVINETGNFVLYYWALPKDITKMTDEERSAYQYEVPSHTHNAIPSYIGYQLVKTDDVQVAQILLDEWNRYLSLFDDKTKAVKRKIRSNVRWW